MTEKEIVCQTIRDDIEKQNFIIYGWLPKRYIIDLLDKIERSGDIKCLQRN